MKGAFMHVRIPVLSISKHFWSSIFCILLLNANNLLTFQERPGEHVTITAVEVPVRVFDKNGFIIGLKKDDFEVYENGIKQQIAGFEVVSRVIAPLPIDHPQSVTLKSRKRSFLLIFNVFDYNDQVGSAIDYFFKNVFREGDRLITVVEDKILGVGIGNGLDATISELKVALKAYKKIAKIEIFRAYSDLDHKAQAAASSLGGEEGFNEFPEIAESGTAVSDFYEAYKHVWEEYRHRMLDVDMELYRSIIARLNQMDGDKWAICFQQRDLFPKLKSQGRLDRALKRYLMSESTINVAARNIEARMGGLEQSFDITKSFPAQKLQALFADANITFHVLIMKSLKQGEMSRDFELGEVNADYEDVLHRISQATGGLTAFSNKVVDTLKEAAAKVDQYYMLVYQSKGNAAKKEQKIDVKVRREGADVFSLKKYVRQKTPTISIIGFMVKDKRISFDIGNCGRIEQGGRSEGKVIVKISLFDDKSERVFDEAKNFVLIADSIHLSLNYEKFESGNYFIIIEAQDVVTGEKDVFSRATTL